MDCSLEYPSISDYLSIFAHDANGHVMTLLATGNGPFFFHSLLERVTPLLQKHANKSIKDPGSLAAMERHCGYESKTLLPPQSMCQDLPGNQHMGPFVPCAEGDQIAWKMQKLRHGRIVWDILCVGQCETVHCHQRQ